MARKKRKDEEPGLMSSWRTERRRLTLRLSNLGAEELPVEVTERVASDFARSASRPDRYLSLDTSTGTPGSRRASISGSSPARSRSARTRSPSLTTVTPSDGRARA